MAGIGRSTQLGVMVGTVIAMLAAASDVGSAGKPVSAPQGAATPEEVGRYLVVVGGCNDCHTQGWAESDGRLPDADWLTGTPVGFRGPWGTSYAANLRLMVQNYTEDAFVARLQAGAGLPPMPWMNVRQLKEEDQRAIYRFIRSLGPAGTAAPVALAPDVEPTTPYIPFVPVFPGGAGR